MDPNPRVFHSRSWWAPLGALRGVLVELPWGQALSEGLTVILWSEDEVFTRPSSSDFDI